MVDTRDQAMAARQAFLFEFDAAVIAPGVAVMEPLLNRDGVDASAAAGILRMAAGAGFTSTGQSVARFAAARLA